MRSRLWIQRMIFLLSILTIPGFGKTIMAKADEIPKEEIKLTEEFLTGTWVCSDGFVCDYRSNVFVDPSGIVYRKCKINNSSVTGTTIMEETASSKIVIINKDTIQVGGYTAVRAESTLGKEYQAQFSNLLIGKWMNYDRDYKLSFEFKKDNSLIVSSNEAFQLSYEVVAGGVRVYKPENAIKDKEDTEDFEDNEDKEDEIIFLRIHEDTLSICNITGEEKFYREGSEVIKASQSGKAEVIGDWIFASEDGKLISQWKMDSSDKLTIDYFGEEKDIQQAYSTSRKDYFIIISSNGKTYQLNRKPSSDNTIAYFVSQDLDGVLVKRDSKDGKNYLKKAETIYQVGKEIQRTQYKKFMDDLYPEVTAISVSAQCMSNLWLDDFIKINTYGSSLNELKGICGQSYEVFCDSTLKNAKITFSYDESQLPYAYKKDLVIMRMDKKTGKKTPLKTTRNLKSNKLAAKITRGGIYYLADSVVMKGGSRDIAKRNPKSTEWARLNDTGDILSLIDFDYIKNNEGSFSVSTVSQLASVVYYVNTTPEANPWIFLDNDIDLSGYDWAPMGWKGPNGLNFEFNGMVEGWNFTISNLHINVDGDNVGFLGYAPTAGVKNLKIIGASIRGNNNVGIIKGSAMGCGYCDNCYVKGEVYGEWAGSMIGEDAITEFRDCTADVTVNGKKFNYLTSEKKQPCKVEVKDYITITMDEKGTLHCPKVTNYDNLSWSVYHNNFRMEDIDAKENQSIQYTMDEPVFYRIYLTAFMNGQYVRVSNVIEKIVD